MTESVDTEVTRNNLPTLVAKLIQENAKLKAEVETLKQRVTALEAKEQSQGWQLVKGPWSEVK
jgi:regulator of replication initiation timing